MDAHVERQSKLDRISRQPYFLKCQVNEVACAFVEQSVAIVVCEVPSRCELTEEEQNELFFSRSDYQESRAAARVVSKESERFGHSKTLGEAYSEKSKSAQESLNQWAANGHDRRGLERWANRVVQ